MYNLKCLFMPPLVFCSIMLVVAGFIQPDFAVPAALVAAWYTWRFYQRQYKQSLDELLNPAPWIAPVPLPVAFGCIKDMLQMSLVSMGSLPAAHWRITSEDETRALLVAAVSFQQTLGAGAIAHNFTRNITLVAQLTPVGANTEVKFNWQFVSPMGTGLVEQIIKEISVKLEEYMQHQSRATACA
jgi:hypothetical protein